MDMDVATVIHLGDESTRQISELVLSTLGPLRAVGGASHVSGNSRPLVLIAECEQDGMLCAEGRKFLRLLKRDAQQLENL